MNPRFVEPLESRQLLSADLLRCNTDRLASPATEHAVLQTLVHAPRVYSAAPRVKAPSIVGVYRGTAKTPRGKQAVTLRIIGQNGNGQFTGERTHPNHGWVSLRVVGTVYSNRTVKFTFSGTDTDGSASGRGSATVSANGKTIAGKFAETEAGTTFRGTLSLRR